jgi:uncharacterized protein
MFTSVSRKIKFVTMALDFSLLFLIFCIAIVYSMVGHGGASGYIAAMVLFAIPVGDIRFYGLILNILVSGIAFYSFYQYGYFKFELLWPFAIASIPFAYLGGTISVNEAMLHMGMAVALIIAAMHMIFMNQVHQHGGLRKITLNQSLPAGAAIGFVSGLLGIGGGIILSPVLIIFRWADAKQAAAISSAFIFLNSVSGLAGQLGKGYTLSMNFGIYAMVAIFGGLLGSTLGSSKLSVYRLKIVLSFVLLLASVKLMISA